jgi:soluble lytic murein transglycosylase-like protein
MPKSYEGALAERGQTPATVRKMMMEGPKKGDYVAPPLESQKPGIGGRGHKYEDAVIKEAERLGVDPQLALHVLYKETGNLKNPETARSKAGALGVMQLMPRTAKELGVDPMNPEENIRGGVVYLKKMMDQFNDPTLALAAYNAGPGRVNQILRSGRGIEALPRETQNYIRMADGGIVAFQNRGLVSSSMPEIDFESINPETGQPYVVAGPFEAIGRIARGGKSIEETYGPNPVKAKVDASVPTTKTFSDEDQGPYTGQTPAPEISKEQIDKLIGGAQGGEKEDGMMKKYMTLLEGREKSSADQRKQDAYLSLLSAGLGMMGGTSPFAAVNIGQGAQAGIAAQAAARKTQAAEEAATLKGFGTAAAAEEYAKQRQLIAGQAREGKIGTIIANREKQLETAAYNNAVKAGGLNFSMLEPAQQQAAIAKEVQRLKSTDPLLSKLYKEYGLPPIEVAQPPDLVSQATERLKKRNLPSGT